MQQLHGGVHAPKQRSSAIPGPFSTEALEVEPYVSRFKLSKGLPTGLIQLVPIGHRAGVGNPVL